MCDTIPTLRGMALELTTRPANRPNNFTSTRNWEAFDSCRNTSRCSQVVTVVDTTPPNLVCGKDLTVECGTTSGRASCREWEMSDTNATLRVVHRDVMNRTANGSANLRVTP